MKINKKILVIFIILFLTIISFKNISFGVDEEAFNRIYSKEYQEYLKLSEEEKAKVEVIPRQFDVPFSVLYKHKSQSLILRGIGKLVDIVTAGEEEPLPTSFILRDEDTNNDGIIDDNDVIVDSYGGINIPVKNQGQYGLCWDFASMRSLETNLSLHGYGNYDFSEWHVAYIEKNGFGNVIDGNSGGSFWHFKKYLSNNHGPVLETEVPYGTQYSEDQFDYIYNLESKAYLKESVDFPTIRKNNGNTYDTMGNILSDEDINLFRDTVKRHIMENGSIYISVDSHSISYINGFTTLYNTSAQSNHAISVIGWDDSFSRENFRNQNGNMPNEDGAYIALNSWGDFDIVYISYEDITVETSMSGIVSATINIEEAAETIQFQDRNLYNAIKKELKKNLISYDDEAMEIVCLGASTITSLDLSNKGINNLSGLEKFEGLQFLYLNNNNITDIDVLWNLKQLYFLDVSYNNLENLGDIQEIHTLEGLYANYNKINNLGNIQLLYNLNMLLLDNNLITDISNLQYLQNLSMLPLNDNKIENIEALVHLNYLWYGFQLQNNLIKDVSCLENTLSESIDLSGNPIETGIDKLTNFLEIRLDNCNLDNSYIEDISVLKNARFLSLCDNSFTDVSGLQCMQLNSLDLSGNTNLNLNTIPMHFEFEEPEDEEEYWYYDDSYSLTLESCNITDTHVFSNFGGDYLRLNNNPITDVSPFLNKYIYRLELKDTNVSDVSGLNNILFLDLSNNSNLINLDKLTGTESLTLQNCNINTLNEIGNLGNLTFLNVNNNNICTLGGIQNFPNLVSIYINNNKVTDIEDIADAQQISWIDLSYNKVSNIEALANLQMVDHIDLSHNEICYIPASLNTTHAYYINLSYNHIANFLQNGKINIGSQTISKNISVKLNETNILYNMPNIIQRAKIEQYKRGYEYRTLFEINNCEIDFTNNIIKIIPEVLGENTATITIIGGEYDGTTYTINYNAQEELELQELTVIRFQNKFGYIEGENFNTDGLIINEIYEGDVEIETQDYTIINGENLQYGQDSITIVSNKNPEITFTISITVYKQDDVVIAYFPDDNLYNTIKNDDFGAYISGFVVGHNDDNNEVLLKKDMIQQITFINLGAKGISNIEGIEVFNNLQTVWLHRNYDLESIEPLRNLERLKNVTLYFTKVNDIELLLQNNEINNFEMVYEAGVLPGVNIDTLELPKFIYQSLTMQEGVTAEVNIYFDISYNEEYDYYYCTNENHKTTVPIVINEEQQNATIKLNKTISEQMLIGPRRVEIIIHGGKTDESSYSAIYYVEKEFDRLRIYGGPIKSHYMVGENFEREGMVVYAVYSDGSRHEIFDYTVLDGENLQAGQNSVTISYTEDGITKTDTQEIFVHGEEDLITVKFPDDNLYNAMKEPDSLPDGGRGVYKDLIMGYNDEENEIIMLKEVVDQVDSLHLMQKGISDITGIENFTNLERLFLSFNYNLESIEQLSSLNKLEHVELQITKVEDISPILSKESIQNIVLRKDDQNVINADMTEVVLPPYIYQSLTMQEGVTAEAYIYYSPSCYEGYYFNNDLEGEKKLTEVIIDEENDVAVVLLDKELTDDQDVGVRGIEVAEKQMELYTLAFITT